MTSSIGWWFVGFFVFAPVYWIAPHLIAKCRKKPISEWKFAAECLLINLFIGYYIIEKTVFFLLSGVDTAPSKYCAIWTAIFFVRELGTLRRRDMLKAKGGEG